MEESVFARFSPEGDFVMAESMGKLLMWRTLTGEAPISPWDLFFIFLYKPPQEYIKKKILV